MKRKHLALLPLAIGMLFGTAAQAQQQTITFEGRVINNTCVPSVGGGGPTGTVPLPLISSNLIPNPGNTSSLTPFSISLSGCDDSATYTMKAYFWQPGAQGGRLVKNPGAGGGNGSGWVYELLNDAGTDQVIVGTNATVVPANNANDPGAAIVQGGGGAAQLNYNVRYYRVAGTLQVGTLNATATYVLYAN